MIKLIFAPLLLVSLSLYADVDPVTTPVLNSGNEPAKKEAFFARENHWVTIFGIESLKYEIPYNFQGDTKNFKEIDQELYGLRLGFGKEFHLGGGMFTSTRADAYYLGMFFTKTDTAEPTVKLDYSANKRSSYMMGIDINQTLSFQFDYKIKNPFMETYTSLILEPFVEAGAGIGRAQNKVDYKFDATSDGGVGSSTIRHEAYSQTFDDKIYTARIGAGFNIISTQGIMFFAKISQAHIGVSDRKSSGKRKQIGQPYEDLPDSAKETTSFNSLMYTVGGGIKF